MDTGSCGHKVLVNTSRRKSCFEHYYLSFYLVGFFFGYFVVVLDVDVFIFNCLCSKFGGELNCFPILHFVDHFFDLSNLNEQIIKIETTNNCEDFKRTPMF